MSPGLAEAHALVLAPALALATAGPANGTGAAGASAGPGLTEGLILGVVLASMVLFGVLEAWRPLRPRREPRLRRWTRNVLTLLLAHAVAGPLRLLLVVPLAVAVQDNGWGLLALVDLPRWAAVMLGLVLLDGSLWAWHVLNHRVPFLWRFHAAHHADLDLDASTALRFHVGELTLSVLFRALQVVVFGIGPALLVAWEALTLVATLFHHSNLRLPARFDRALAHVIPTPRMHGIHHSVVREERDSNYGIMLSAWDVAFRTLRLDVPQESVTIGLPGLQDPGLVRFWNVQRMPLGRDVPGS